MASTNMQTSEAGLLNPVEQSNQSEVAPQALLTSDEPNEGVILKSVQPPKSLLECVKETSDKGMRIFLACLYAIATFVTGLLFMAIDHLIKHVRVLDFNKKADQAALEKQKEQQLIDESETQPLISGFEDSLDALDDLTDSEDESDSINEQQTIRSFISQKMVALFSSSSLSQEGGQEDEDEDVMQPLYEEVLKIGLDRKDSEEKFNLSDGRPSTKTFRHLEGALDRQRHEILEAGNKVSDYLLQDYNVLCERYLVALISQYISKIMESENCTEQAFKLLMDYSSNEDKVDEAFDLIERYQMFNLLGEGRDFTEQEFKEYATTRREELKQSNDFKKLSINIEDQDKDSNSKKTAIDQIIMNYSENLKTFKALESEGLGRCESDYDSDSDSDDSSETLRSQSECNKARLEQPDFKEAVELYFNEQLKMDKIVPWVDGDPDPGANHAKAVLLLHQLVFQELDKDGNVDVAEFENFVEHQFEGFEYSSMNQFTDPLYDLAINDNSQTRKDLREGVLPRLFNEYCENIKSAWKKEHPQASRMEGVAQTAAGVTSQNLSNPSNEAFIQDRQEAFGKTAAEIEASKQSLAQVGASLLEESQENILEVNHASYIENEKERLNDAELWITSVVQGYISSLRGGNLDIEGYKNEVLNKSEQEVRNEFLQGSGLSNDDFTRLIQKARNEFEQKKSSNFNDNANKYLECVKHIDDPFQDCSYGVDSWAASQQAREELMDAEENLRDDFLNYFNHICEKLVEIIKAPSKDRETLLNSSS
ncbi:MAG: hypothetical protein S4CHLAM20_09410 [Chlamydiia bacterium]|nr:hypothetical protein [Chlamydiia bacterium]